MALRVRLAESNKGSKERQVATLGLRFIEVSVKRESTVLIYLFMYLLNCRTNLRKFSVSFQGPTYYNSIENDIKESNSLHLFKTKLKKKLYMNY